MNVHAPLPLTDAIISALQRAGLSVGDAIRPDPLPSQGYVVVYPLTGGTANGPIGHPDDDASVIYQLTSVGRIRKECEWVADKARRALLAASLPIGDRMVVRVGVDMLGGILRDDDVQPPVFYSPDRYRVMTTPTAA